MTKRQELINLLDAGYGGETAHHKAVAQRIEELLGFEEEQTLPTEPGIYTSKDSSPQERYGEYHHDGMIIWYLNTSGNWVDIGWGDPSVSDLPLTKWTPEVSE